MANNALALRMKYRKLDAAQLQEIVDNEKSTETEVKVASEFLAKMGGTPAKAKKAEPKEEVKKAPKKAVKKAEAAETKDESIEQAAKNQVTEFESEEQLTPEEKERLAKAEKEFDARQKNRKTPSKSDKAMKPAKEKKEKSTTPRETKRQNLDESAEVPGLKVGSKVTLTNGDGAVGEITRVYQSGDGKEKCMVKFGDEKPIKKRVTAVTLVTDEEPKKAPAKKKK